MRTGNRTPEVIFLALTALTLTAFYVVLVRWLPPDALWGGDQGMKLLQIEALAGSPPRIGLAYAGSYLAPEDRFAPFLGAHAVRRGDRWYSVFPLAYAAISTPPYRAFGFPGLYIVPAGSVVAASLLAYVLARRLCRRRESALAMLATAFASPLLFYGAVLWEHALATALATGAVVALTGRESALAPRALLGAGILLGIATWMRSEMYVFVAAGAIAVALSGARARGTAWFVGGAVAALIPLWVLNTLLYGDPAGVHITYNFMGEGEALGTRLARHLALRGAVALDVVRMEGLLGWAGYAVAGVGAVVLWRAPGSRSWGAGFVGVGSLLAATAGAADQARGAFAMSLVAACPWLPLLAGLAAPASRSGPSLVRFLGVLAVGYVGLVVMSSPVPAGVNWGGRMLMPIVPILVVLAVVGRARLCGIFAGRALPVARVGMATATGAALAAGVLVQIGGITSLNEFKLRNREYTDALVRTGDRVFVASARWPVLAAAPIWEDRIFLRADTHADFCTLEQRLADAGIKSFTYLEVPIFVPDVSKGSCPTRAGYHITGRTRLRRVSVIRGIHFATTGSP